MIEEVSNFEVATFKPHRSEQYLLNLRAGSLHSSLAHLAFDTVRRLESVSGNISNGKVEKGKGRAQFVIVLRIIGKLNGTGKKNRNECQLG